LTALAAPALIPALDEDSRRWLADLRSAGHRRDEAERRLYALLRKAADFEVRRRISGPEAEDLITQSAGDALFAVLRKLDDFRGESRFTTWAYKFALYEAAAKTRRRAWQGRELPTAPEDWPAVAAQGHDFETAERLRAIARAIETRLTPHQREVLLALAVNGVPIDVLAERRGTTRGALYKTLHDARRSLRRSLEEQDA
jgi:RNA polymerase sigma-70 factor (ECF subfamily)